MYGAKAAFGADVWEDVLEAAGPDAEEPWQAGAMNRRMQEFAGWQRVDDIVSELARLSGA
jgi:hypothetical protein